ncbi:integrase [Aeromonas veronii]|nr:integrase [Aeromonas veronii]
MCRNVLHGLALFSGYVWGYKLKLTESKVKAAKVAEDGKPLKLFDGGGLFLYVTHAGRYWRLKYRIGGKERVHSIGPYPLVGLKEARLKAADVKRVLLDGGDPAMEKQKRKQEALAAEPLSEWAKRWFDSYQAGVNSATAKKTWMIADSCLLPFIGSRPVGEVSTFEVVELIRDTEQRRSPVVAARALQILSSVFGYAATSGVIQANPAAQLGGLVATPPIKHHPAMAAKDVPDFLRQLEEEQIPTSTKQALRLIIFTMLRVNEVVDGRWSEVDFDAMEWRIPAERMKKKREHVVPLSQQAAAILRELKEENPTFPFILPSKTKPHTQGIYASTINLVMRKMGYEGKATPHGFRATASTALNEKGFSPDAIELQLSHIDTNRVRATYNKALRLQERRDMLQWWADSITQA